MKKWLKKLFFALALIAVIFMAGHIFQHLIPGWPEPIGQCQICNALAGLSVPTVSGLAVILLLICRMVFQDVPAMPFFNILKQESRAPPAA